MAKAKTTTKRPAKPTDATDGTSTPAKPARRARAAAPGQPAKPNGRTPGASDPGSTIDALIARGTAAGHGALRELPAELVVPRLLVAMGDPRPRVRRFAYEASTGTPERRAIVPLAAIVRGLADPDPAVRLSVLVALNRGTGMQNAAVYAPRGAEIRDALVPLLGDPDKRVKSQSAVMWRRLELGPLPAADA